MPPKKPKLDPFVEKLRERIDGAGVTVGEVCAQTTPRVHQSVVYRWFAGETLPTLRVLRPLLAALDRIEAQAGDAR
jgi:hypothetical protein